MVEGDLRGSGAVVRDRDKVKPPPQKPAPELKRPGVGWGPSPRQMAVRLSTVLADPPQDKRQQEMKKRQEMKDRRQMELREKRREEKAGARDDRPAPVSPAALFPKLAATVTADQMVDAAIDRFLQRPLHPDKRKALVESLGESPLKLGSRETDQRVRDMLSLILSTPEYQVH
jgi:hypothetical protein